MQSDSSSESKQESPASAGVPLAHEAPSHPIYPIADLIVRPDFPHSAVGEHVEVGGVLGVVTDVVKHSLRVRLLEGGMMSYNLNVLRKLYGPHTPPPEVPESATEAPEPPPPPKTEPKREVIENPDFAAPLQLIELFVDQPDFPKSAYGRNLDLHGYEGVVVEIVHRSLKVRSRQGVTRSYNADGLRRLYGKARDQRL